MEPENNYFFTESVDLAAFLAMNDLRYVGYTTDLDISSERLKGVLKFEDPRGIARDLERAFLNSEFKKYRDMNKYFLKQVHMACKSANFNGGSLNDSKKNRT